MSHGRRWDEEEPQRSVRLFVGFHSADEAFRARLVTHLAPVVGAEIVEVWDATCARAGDAEEAERQARLAAADLVAFLVSPDFLADPRCVDDVKRALDRAAEGGCRVVPIRVRAAHLEGTALSGLSPLPPTGDPIAQRPREQQDPTLAEIVREIKQLANTLMDVSRGPERGLFAPRQNRVLLPRVRQVVAIRHPDARVEELSARRPFEGLLVLTDRVDGNEESEPIGVLDGPMSEDALRAFVDHVEAPFRKVEPLLKSRIVHTGPLAADDLQRAARIAGVRLTPFDAYQQVASFEKYLTWQTRRIDADRSYPDAIYVEQRGEVRIRLDRTKTDHVLGALESLLTDPYPRFILVLGDFGTGKTFLMRQLSRRLAERHANNPVSAPPPVLVEMRNLEKSRGLNKLLAQHFEGPESGNLRVEAFRYLLSEGKAALLFDGFDELAFRVTYDQVIQHFQTVLDAAQGKAKVVVTSRTAHFLTDNEAERELAVKASWKEGYRLVKLFPFDEAQIRRALEKRLSTAEEVEKHLTLLREVEDLMGLSANPRMLGFILELPASALEEAKSPAGKITSASLYELLITRWLEGEIQRAEEGKAEVVLSLPQLRKAVTDFALLLWERTEKGLFQAQIPASLWASLKGLDPDRPLDPEEARAAAGSRSLLIRSEEGRFSFMHESILDWLVARAAGSEAKESGEVACLGQRKMSDLMTDFFCAMAGPEAAVRWARAALRGGQNVTDVAIENANRVLRRTGTDPEEDEIVVALDLSGHDMRGQDLSGTSHLAGAFLEKANLSGATLVGANLSSAALAGANLAAANLERANLQHANLEGANLRESRLLRADLRGAQLAGADLKYANLLAATLAPEALASASLEAACPAHPSHAEPATGMHLAQGGLGWSMGLAIHPDGVLLAVGNASGEIGLWNLRTGKTLRSWVAHAGAVTSLAFSPDGKTLASGFSDNSIRLWDTSSHRLIASLQGHSDSVRSVAFSPDGKTLASGSYDNSIRLWDTSSHRLIASLQGHAHGVLSVAFSPDGKTLASGSSDKSIRLWDTSSHLLIASLQGHANGVWSVAFSPDGKTLASGSYDKSIRLWDTSSHLLIASLQGHAHWVRSVAFSPDGKTLASGSDDKSILWDTSSHLLIASLRGHANRVLSVAFSPDGKTLASGSDDKSILWDTSSHLLIASLQGHAHWVRSVAFSPDGKTLASGSSDNSIRLWDTSSHRLIASLQGHANWVRSVAFSPDGKTLASGSDDGTIRFWRVADGACLGVLVPAEQGWAAYSPDGRYKLSGDVANRFWHVVGLVRFEPGELEGYEDAFTDLKPVRVKEDEPLW